MKSEWSIVIMVRPVPPPEPYHKPPPVNLQTAALNATANSVNSVVYSMYMLTHWTFPAENPKNSADPASFAAAMQSINQLIAYLQANPPPAPTPGQPSPLYDVYSQLTDRNVNNNYTSLADIAADYSKNGFTTADLGEFNSAIQSTDVNSPYNQMALDFESDSTWGSQYNVDATDQKALLNQLDRITTDFTYVGNPPVLTLNVANFLSDVSGLNTLIAGLTPPLDGMAQFMSNLINGKLDSAGDTLATISAANLTAMLTPAMIANLNNMCQQAYTYEKQPPP